MLPSFYQNTKLFGYIGLYIKEYIGKTRGLRGDFVTVTIVTKSPLLAAANVNLL